jgi:hypothetical protein
MRGRRLDASGRSDRDDVVLSAIRGEVDRLRLTLTSDLALAAAAVDDSKTDLAGEIVEADRVEMAEFAQRTLRRLREERPGRRTVRRPVRRAGTWAVRLSPALAVAALAAVVTVSAAPTRAPHRVMSPISQVTRSLEAFQATVTSERNDSTAVLHAAAALRASITELLSQARHDPATASQLVQVLHTEEALLLAVHPSCAPVLLPQIASLLAQLSPSVPPAPANTPGTVPVPTPAPSITVQTASPRPKASNSPYPQRHSGPSASPTGKATSPPSSSPAPSPDASTASGSPANPSWWLPAGTGLSSLS